MKVFRIEEITPKPVIVLARDMDDAVNCAILLDDNNRKTVARLWFNSATARYLGTFKGKDETRMSVTGPVDIYQHSKAILARLEELAG